MDATIATKKCSSCPEGHNIKPLTEFSRCSRHSSGYKSQCKACRSQAQQRWLAKGTNRANVYARRQQWGEMHIESECERLSNYRKRNRQLLCAKQQRYYTDHAAIICAKQRPKTKAWQHQHPEERRLIQARRRARKAGLPDTLTHAQWAFALEYWHHACAVCEQPAGLWTKLVMDHVIPIASPQCPGTTALNALPLCDGLAGCNTSKQDAEFSLWLTRRYGPHKARAIIRKAEAYFAVVRER